MKEGSLCREVTQHDTYTKVEALQWAPNSGHTPVLKQGKVLEGTAAGKNATAPFGHLRM